MSYNVFILSLLLCISIGFLTQISDTEFEINVNSIQQFSINYESDTIFNFTSETIHNDLIVNMHSINCKIKINIENSNTNNNNINQMNDDLFSFRINPEEINNVKIRVNPILSSADERIIKNYKNKTCPLIITNMEENSVTILELNNASNLFFDENNSEYIFSYKVNEIELDSPIALSLTFNQKSQFEINIDGINKNFRKNETVFNSTYIFFDNENYQEVNEFNISIKQINEIKPIFMNIKMIKKNSTSILEQNNLNYGFITSKIEYQYYYMEVFKDQEGEIMLHNKIANGILIAEIKTKNESIDLNNTNNYPNKGTNTSLILNQHTFKLYFSYNDTSKCGNGGCYLLITYYNKNYDEENNNNIIGYEYTILSRIWDYIEYSSQIVNIPFNEYILGTFDKGSITHHYYSIFIPNGTERIIIQYEGNYLDGFIAEGIVKINTIKDLDGIFKLDIINNQHFFNLKKDDFNNKYISLAFRSKNYFEDIFSFYYFRIFYLKANETLFYPVDSNLGNLCLPEKNNETDKYYCDLILNNNYNELSSNFSIAGTNQIEYFKIFYAPIYKNENKEEIKYDYKEFKYIFSNKNESKKISHIFFRFEFSEGGIKNIVSAFADKSGDNCPQIYSGKMYLLYNITKLFHYSLIHDYVFYYKWIGGYSGGVDLDIDLDLRDKNYLYITRNFRGKPVGLQVSNKTKNMTFITSNELLFYTKLNYNNKNKFIEEIISGETRSEIIKEGNFPLYYYLNLRKKQNISVDINIRINSYNISQLKNDFEIKGYIIKEDTLKKMMKGEIITLNDKDAFNGTFIESYKFGFLEINKDVIKYDQYILISINSKFQKYFESNLLIEIVNNEYSGRYFMPINQYIIETFDIKGNLTRNFNKYYIDVNDMMNNYSTVLIEFSPNYNDLELIFEPKNENNETINPIINYTCGFQKYRIKPSLNETMVNFTIINPKNRTDTNYIIRYYYTEQDKENRYILENDSFHWEKDENNSNGERVSISLTHSGINIIRNNSDLNNTGYNITFYIHAYLFDKEESESGEELLNTSTIIHNKKYKYKNETINKYIYNNRENISLYFSNISKTDNKIFILQLRVNVYIEDNIFNEEFLTYTSEIDLTKINEEDNNKGKENDDDTMKIIIGISAGLGILAIVTIVILFINRRLKKDNKELKEKVLSIGYSAGIEKNVIINETQSKKDQYYETTFI